MQTQKASRNDGVVIAIILIAAVFLLLMYDTYFSSFGHMLIGAHLVLSFIAGMIARDRRIGFGTVFLVSLLLSSIVGFVIALTSKSLKDVEETKKMQEIVYTTSVAEQLLKLNELRKEGILTDEEFQAQKAKLLGA